MKYCSSNKDSKVAVISVGLGSVGVKVIKHFSIIESLHRIPTIGTFFFSERETLPAEIAKILLDIFFPS